MAIRSSARRRKVATAERKALPAGDCGQGAAEFGRPWSCSRDRIDCRNRQEALGPSRPDAKSVRTTTKGLASRRESAWEVKERRKPGRPWQSGGTGGGLPTSIGNGAARKRSPGSTCRWKASRAGKAALFDEGAVEAVLVPRRPPGVRSVAGRDRGRQRSFVQRSPGRKRPNSAGAREGPPPHRAPREGTRSGATPKDERTTEAGAGAVKRYPAGVGLPQGGLTPHGRTARSGAKVTGHMGGKYSAVGAAQAARPEIERFTSARVEGRLQKSVRSILSGLLEGSREANQGSAG